MKLVNLLESTLWNRKLAPTLEDIVNALVAQIFEGIRDHCVGSAEMKVSYVCYSQDYSHHHYCYNGSFSYVAFAPAMRVSVLKHFVN